MVAARASARDFILDYKEHPGVLPWNSCNVIENEATDFLISMYPVYKHYDPYATCSLTQKSPLSNTKAWKQYSKSVTNVPFTIKMR